MSASSITTFAALTEMNVRALQLFVDVMVTSKKIPLEDALTTDLPALQRQLGRLPGGDTYIPGLLGLSAWARKMEARFTRETTVTIKDLNGYTKEKMGVDLDALLAEMKEEAEQDRLMAGHFGEIMSIPGTVVLYTVSFYSEGTGGESGDHDGTGASNTYRASAKPPTEGDSVSSDLRSDPNSELP
jgi:hypothetical protein